MRKPAVTETIIAALLLQGCVSAGDYIRDYTSHPQALVSCSKYLEESETTTNKKKSRGETGGLSTQDPIYNACIDSWVFEQADLKADRVNGCVGAYTIFFIAAPLIPLCYSDAFHAFVHDFFSFGRKKTWHAPHPTSQYKTR